MILRTRYAGDYELRGMFADASSVPAPGSPRFFASTGGAVDDDLAGGLPAASAAVRLLAETGGMLPLQVREGTLGDPRAPRVESAPESDLLALPNTEQAPFFVWSFLIASMQRGGGFLLKLKARGRVVELALMDPRRVRPKIKNGELVFRVRDGSQTKTLTRSDVLYVPGLLTRSHVIGTSVVEAHANALGVSLAQQEFEARFYANDATPGGILTVPGNPTVTQRNELRDSWEGRHSGLPQSHRIGVLWGGAEYKEVGISLEDAQFIQARQYGVEEVSRVFRVEKKLLTGEADETDPEKLNLRFLTYSLAPWLARVEQTISLDPDLFPDRRRFAKFNVDELLRADFRTRAAAYKDARQGGWATANEIRGREGEPPHPDGDELQQTPVGGAPNMPQQDA